MTDLYLLLYGSLIHIALNMTHKCKQMMFLFDETESRNVQSIEMNRFLVFVFQMQEKISHFILLLSLTQRLGER